VRPDSQNLGIGLALVKAIEGYYKYHRYELFVGLKIEKDISLYEKLGYTIYKAGKCERWNIHIFYMQKVAILFKS
jgi:ribosomal protein S18 acetylase RimI-like enzyme